MAERTTTNATFPALVLFDLDDTLFDDRFSRVAALRGIRTREPIFRRVPLPQLVEEYGRLLDLLHDLTLSGELSKWDARSLRFERLAMYCGSTIEDATARRLAREYHETYQLHRRSVPGSPKLLERLRHRAKIGVVTNNLPEEQVEKLEAIGLRSAVDELVVSGAVGYRKPDPRIFEIALRRTGFDAPSAVMIGDSWENDVLGARAAGIRPIWLNRFDAPSPEPGRVVELTSYRPLGPVIERIAGD
ncbi:MAG: HAD family hydrolase [Thermoplasmata archaeon]